ncbi:MAG: DUF4831 family protein [Bacteroidales bacterium]|nr:DUF4831 family protein [Bacteroidales bacterium]
MSPKVFQISFLAVCCALLCGCGAGMRTYMVSETTAFKLPGGVLYALPRTQVQVSLDVLYSDNSQAPYHQYAREYLGVDTLPNRYDLHNVNLSAVGVPDMKAIYYVVPGANSLFVAPNGLLLGINQPPSEDTLAPFATGPLMQFRHVASPAQHYLIMDNTFEHTDTFYSRLDNPGHPSIVVAKTDQRNLRGQAVETAQRLQDIQEKQRQLLYGEYEGNYSAQSVRYLNEQLEQMKAPLLAKFLPRRRTETFTFYFEPSETRDLVDSQSVVLCYFSPTVGITDSAMRVSDSRPVLCTVTCNNSMRRATRFAASRGRAKRGSREDHRSLKYRMPQEATVVVSCQGYSPVAANLPVMQFGATATLPSSGFSATFSPRTGTLQQIIHQK